ncbi:kinase-like protein [Ceratobasidium sp. AG-I]|nr:kinase-like protein [Ceratobasidium sp. AG-I]
MDTDASRLNPQWSSPTSRTPRDFPLAQLETGRITTSDGRTIAIHDGHEISGEFPTRGFRGTPGKMPGGGGGGGGGGWEWEIPGATIKSESSSLPSLNKRLGDTFIVHAAAADIWLVELAITQTTSPVQYICKTLRVAPESFQDRRGSYFLDNMQGNNVDRIEKDFIRDFHLKLAEWNSIQHNNIVQVYESSDKAGAYLNVEFCIHGTARQISDVLKGVEYLHTRTPPIIHGCLNMDKLFVSGDGTTRVGEFGLAAFTRSFALLAPSISYAGLSRWMSPELVNFDPEEGAPRPTTASDVWALGCTLYEIVSEELPYQKYKHELRVRREIMRGIPPAYRPSNNEKGEISIWSIFESCWEGSPNARPSASNIRVEHGVLTQAPAPLPQRPRPPPSLPPPPPASPSAASSSRSPFRGSTKSTQFTQRPVRQIAWPPVTPTNEILSHVNNWHKKHCDQQGLAFQLLNWGNTWQAVPIIFGEPHPQYAGLGESTAQAKAAAAQKIADSGHCATRVDVFKFNVAFACITLSKGKVVIDRWYLQLPTEETREPPTYFLTTT